ncbi:MAG: rRNA maturation RNase YbeY [Patescibacteria group bacterium]
MTKQISNGVNKISVISLDKKFEKFKKDAEKVALKILKISNKSDISAEIYLIGNQKMKFLNKKFRGKDKITNILSFEEPLNFICPPPAGGLKHKKIGEIYLNLEKTMDYGLQTTDKKAVDCSLLTVDRLLTHGFLHLFGYNHQKKNDRMKMERIEQFILARL